MVKTLRSQMLLLRMHQLLLHPGTAAHATTSGWATATRTARATLRQTAKKWAYRRLTLFETSIYNKAL